MRPKVLLHPFPTTGVKTQSQTVNPVSLWHSRVVLGIRLSRSKGRKVFRVWTESFLSLDDEKGKVRKGIEKRPVSGSKLSLISPG